MRSPLRDTVLALLVVTILSFASMNASADGNGLAILLTDYGADSIYVGILKGAMYSKAPRITIDSVTNSVPNYDIRTGAYILAEATGAYPKGTVFCTVVDPGVGTQRRCIVLKTKAGQYFVGPDNGLLTLVADRFGIEEIRECTNTDLWHGGSTSTTFHGRDIFGPVAAALANGIALEKVGPKIEKMVRIELRPSEVRDGAAIGEVMRVDSYGNIITTVTNKDFEALGIKHGDRVSVSLGNDTFDAPFAVTYGSVDKGERLVLLQSSQFVELAMNQASLVEATGAEPGTLVTIKKVP